MVAELHGSISVTVKVWLPDWAGKPVIDPLISTEYDSPGGYVTISVVVILNTPVAGYKEPIAHVSTPDDGGTQAYSITQLESETV